MSVAQLKPERVEVWAGKPKGSETLEWYVEHIEIGDDEGLIVSDRATEAEAMIDAREWGLPIFVKR